MGLRLVSVWSQAGCLLPRMASWRTGVGHGRPGVGSGQLDPCNTPSLGLPTAPCRGFGESTKAIYPTGAPGLVLSVLFSYKPDETFSEPH